MTATVIDAVITRLSDVVEPLHQRVDDVADLARMMAANILPKVTPAAWVVPIGEDAEPAEHMTGGLRQRVAETVGIILVHSVAGDSTGAKARAVIDGCADLVKTGLIGWAPLAGIDPFEFRRARLIGAQNGAVFLQIDVLTRWYLRA